MISLGHLLVILLLIAREIIYTIGIIILMRQWLKAKVRYFTDLPFLISVAMCIMCSYTFIEIYFVTFDPGAAIDTPLRTIVYLIDLNLVAVVSGIIFVMLLVVWFPTQKKGVLMSTISWIIGTEIAILFSAFIDIRLMDYFLVLIALPTYVIFVITFLFAYRQKRLPNVHPLLIGLGMSIIIVAQILSSIFGQMGNRLAGIYTDASWPAMIVWLAGFILMIIGFTRKAPYHV